MSGRIAVTGAAGFIGRHLTRALRERFPDKALVLVDLRVPPPPSADPAVTWLTGDVGSTEVTRALASARPELIVHLAWVTDTLVRDPHRMIRSNLDAFRRLLEVAGGVGARVVYASSAGVYGNGSVPMREAQAPRPHSPYAVSKLLMEQVAEQWCDRGGASVIGLRFFNVFGPGEAHKGHAASMVSQIHRLLLGDAPVELFRPGDQSRDFVYVADVVHAVCQAATSEACGVVNVGSGTATTFNELTTAMARALGRRPRIRYVDPPAWEYQERTQADLSRARRVLGFEPLFPLGRAIACYAAEMAGAA